MSTAKPEQHALELVIHLARVEGGVIAMRDWLVMQRDANNKAWPSAQPQEVPALQGEARMIAKLLRTIEEGPKLKQVGEA